MSKTKTSATYYDDEILRNLFFFLSQGHTVWNFFFRKYFQSPLNFKVLSFFFLNFSKHTYTDSPKTRTNVFKENELDGIWRTITEIKTNTIFFFWQNLRKLDCSLKILLNIVWVP